MGIVCVSSCRCCVSVVHPVAILSAVFCVICSLCLMLLVTICWKRTQVWVLLWLCMLRGSFPFVSPHVVDVSALSICIVLRAYVVVISMCLLYVSLGSRVSPSIYGLMFMGSVMLSICSSRCVLYSGVKRVHAVLSGLRMRLFV